MFDDDEFAVDPLFHPLHRVTRLRGFCVSDVHMFVSILVAGYKIDEIVSLGQLEIGGTVLKLGDLGKNG